MNQLKVKLYFLLVLIPIISFSSSNQCVNHYVIKSTENETVNIYSVEKFLKNLPSYLKKGTFKLKELQRTFHQLKSDIKENMTTANLDSELYSIYGFHHDLNDPHFSRRTWGKLEFDKITPEEVVGISPELFAAVARYAMEVEAPTIPYAYETGESFSNIFPIVGRFMGKDVNQKQYTEENGTPVCESPWCAEEKRHAGFLAQIVYRITGEYPSPDNSHIPGSHARDANSALEHLGQRQTYEWNATSAYFFLLAHSSGHLREAFKNILYDEIKHLTLMSTGFTYVYGYRPWMRLETIIKNSLKIKKGHDASRTDADLKNNKEVVVKLVLTHLLVELEMRKYVGTVPLSIMRDFFDSPSELPPLGESGLTKEQKQEIEQTRKKFADQRSRLELWQHPQAKEMLNTLNFYETHKAIISKIVNVELSGFKGANKAGSSADKLIKEKINILLKDKKLLTYFGLEDLEVLSLTAVIASIE